MPALQLVTELMAAAVLYTGYPALPAGDLPAIRELSPAAMVQEICPDNPQECRGVVAQFDWTAPQIRLSTALDLDDVQGQSFLLHELVHVLQHRHRPEFGGEDCQLNLRGEQEAYRVQNTYLARHGLNERHGVMLRYMRCPPQPAVTTAFRLEREGRGSDDTAVFEAFMQERFPDGVAPR